MNERQRLAFENPIQFGRSFDESIFEEEIGRKGLRLHTKLTVQAPILYRPGVWSAEGSVLDGEGKPLLMVVLNSDARRTLSVLLLELLEGVGVGKCEMTESGKKLIVSRDLTREEFEELAQIMNGHEPLPEITRAGRYR
jgi:hypothetical protein